MIVFAQIIKFWQLPGGECICSKICLTWRTRNVAETLMQFKLLIKIPQTFKTSIHIYVFGIITIHVNISCYYFRNL